MLDLLGQGVGAQACRCIPDGGKFSLCLLPWASVAEQCLCKPQP
jgi:hypothetical protein